MPSIAATCCSAATLTVTLPGFCASTKERAHHVSVVRPSGSATSGRVVHLELNGMRRVLETEHLGPLQLDVAADLLLAEHVAGQQEVVVGLQRLQRLAQAAA